MNHRRILHREEKIYLSGIDSLSRIIPLTGIEPRCFSPIVATFFSTYSPISSAVLTSLLGTFSTWNSQLYLYQSSCSTHVTNSWSLLLTVF